jgi:hypothetical protein
VEIGSGHSRVVGAPRSGRLALAATAATLLAFASASPAHAGEIVVKERTSGGAGKHAIEDYWTAKRIAAARPLEVVRSEDGEATVRRGHKDPFSHPAPFETGPVADPAVAPNTVNGKLYGKIRGVGPYECSATSVDAPNRGLIMTAGHCVAEPGLALASKLAFVPAFDAEVRPFGTWVFRKIVVLKSWRRNSNFNYDYSAVATSPQNGVNLEDAVGGALVATKLPVRQTYDSVGYPNNFQKGQTMWHCIGDLAGRDPRPIPNGPRPIAMGCDMGLGSSGGGWFVNGFLNSVTSFGYDDHPDVSYGPYFGKRAAEVYEKGAAS